MKLELLAKCLNELVKDRPEFADKDICIEQTSNNESKIYVAQYDETSKSWTKLYWIKNLDTIKESIKQNMKKTYKVKNYKGNLVESLEKFSRSHEGMKIVEATEKNNELKIICEVEDYEDYDDAVDTDSNYGDFWVELYKDHYGDPIRKEFDNFKDAFNFADSKTKGKQYEAILIAINVAGGPSIASSYDNIHGCWVGRTK